MGRFRYAIPLIIALFVVSACGGGAVATPDRTPAPDSTPVDDDGTATADPTPEQKSGSLNFAMSGRSLIYVPTLLTLERLAEMGYTIDIIETGSNSVMMQAAVDGLVHMVSPTVAAQMAAIDAGWEPKWIMQRSFNEFVLVARAEYDSCDSLDGQVLAIHAETDTTGLLARNWIDENCSAGSEPDLQLVPGSENRLVGLLQDQLAASPVELSDWRSLDQERPGDFHIVGNWTEEFPLVAGVYAVQPEWLAENREMALDFVRVHLDVWDELAADEEFLIETAQRFVPEVDPDILAAVVVDYIARGIYPIGGGLEEEAVQTSLDFFSAVGDFEPPSAEELIDRSLLDEALAER